MQRIAVFLSLAILCICVVNGIPPVNVVASVRGKKYDISAETVEEVLQQVEKTAELEAGQQHVLFRGKVLNHEDKLEELGIAEGDILNIVKKRLQRSKALSDEGDDEIPASVPSSFGDSLGLSPEDIKKAQENMSPEDMQKAMSAMDNLLDSNFIEEYFGDEEKIEAARLNMLKNIDQYENTMPGFREQAQELASDPQKWKEAMQSAKEQMLKLKEKRDQMKSKGESPKDTSVADVREEDEE